MPKEAYIASLDVGTTSVRCFILDSNCKIKGIDSDKVELINEQPGYFEIDPNRLWESIVKVLSNAIQNSNIPIREISCLGISTQRATFITWDKETEEYFHNFITWKDCRADSLVKKWNSSLLLRSLNIISYILYLISRSKRFLAGSVIKMMNSQVTMRLMWQLENNEKLIRAVQRKTALFGTLDSWLLYKMRKGNEKNLNVEHISDITSCSATGFFDPFTLSWASWGFFLFSIKKEMLPTVVDNSYNYGYVHKSILGAPIKIGCSMSDQSAAMWGSCCLKDGDVKITLGTGAFLDLNTSSICHASVQGLYPLVAWKLSSQRFEGAANDTGTIINWGRSLGFYDDPSESSDIAESVEDSNGVFFVPAFSGLGPPINDYKAASGFLGIQPTTTKAQLVRALLESIVFRVVQIYQCTVLETNYKLTSIRVDGGVSKNNFICQLLADITGLCVERAESSESSVLGAAFISGINQGIWTIEEITTFRKIDHIFIPRPEIKEKLLLNMKAWENVVNRFKGWYST